MLPEPPPRERSGGVGNKTGTIKFYKIETGFGIIDDDDAGKIKYKFVASSIADDSLKQLLQTSEGANARFPVPVTFDSFFDKGVPAAKNIHSEYAETNGILRQLTFEQFTPLQEKAFYSREFWDKRRRFLIGSTSSGKTLIPFLTYLVLGRRQGRSLKMLYVVPYRALAVQKGKEFAELLQLADEPCKVLVSTREYCTQDALIQQGNTDIAIVIYEKVYTFACMGDAFLSKYDFLVLDEIGVVENEERGIKADIILERASEISRLNVFVLATPHLNWKLYTKAYDFCVVREDTRPVPIEEIVMVHSNIGFRFLRKDGKLGIIIADYANHDKHNLNDFVAYLCVRERREGKKVIVFVGSRKAARDIAHFLCEAYEENGMSKPPSADLMAERDELMIQLGLDEDDLVEIWDDERDYRAFVNGIAFHHASLPPMMRERIESGILNRDGDLSIVVATDTLAYGLNSNVDTVILPHMIKNRGDKKSFLTVNEYMNYIGRAGRLGWSGKGTAYVFINETNRDEWTALREKVLSPDPVQSNFSSLDDGNECAFFILGLFQNDFAPLSAEELRGKLKKIPAIGFNNASLRSLIEESLQLLSERKLLVSCNDDESNEGELSATFRLTQKGVLFKSYVLKVASYDEVVKVVSSVLLGKEPLWFDYFFRICHTAELLRGNAKLVQRGIDAEEVIRSFDRDFSNPRRRLDISGGMKTEILEHEVCRKVKEKSKLEEPDIQWLIKLRMAQSLYLWGSGYSLEKISAASNHKLTFGTMKNLGERASYLTDVASVCVASDWESSKEEGLKIRRLSTALFYGIRPDLLERRQIVTIEPYEGLRLRLLSTLICLGEDLRDRKPTENELRRISKIRKRIESFDGYGELLDSYHLCF